MRDNVCVCVRVFWAREQDKEDNVISLRFAKNVKFALKSVASLYLNYVSRQVFWNF